LAVKKNAEEVKSHLEHRKRSFSLKSARTALHSQTKIASLQHQKLMDRKNSNPLETEPRSHLVPRGCCSEGEAANERKTEFRRNSRILGMPVPGLKFKAESEAADDVGLSDPAVTR
jgi:hypothetical protein